MARPFTVAKNYLNVDISSYPSQTSYVGGALMCTSACLHWALAVLKELVAPQCSVLQMDYIMKSASYTHSYSVGVVMKCTLQTQEIIDIFPLPHEYCSREYFGVVGYTPPHEHEEWSVDIHDLNRIISCPSALVFTANGHTSALASFPDGIFHFDSVGTTVRHFSSQIMNFSEIVAPSHGNMPTGTAFTIVVLEKKRL